MKKRKNGHKKDLNYLMQTSTIWGMHITWHGLTAVRLQTKNAEIVIDPFSASVGIKMPSGKVDVLASTDMSDPRCNAFDQLRNGAFRIEGPGEFEIKGTFIYGLPKTPEQGKGSLLFIQSEDLSVAHLGWCGTDLTAEQLEYVEGVDVLLFSVGALPESRWSKIVSQVEPRVIIPIAFHVPGIKEKFPGAAQFLKALGAKDIKAEPKIILKVKDLPQEETKIMLLEQV